jgi:hypothetical protein
MMPVPDPGKATPRITKRLEQALDAMGQRQILPFLETAFAQCDNPKRGLAMANDAVVLPPELASADRQELDDAVLELIGVRGAGERQRLRERLYQEVVLFYRQVRILELQAMENRRRAKKGRIASARDVAAEIYESIDPARLRRFPDEFLPTDEPLETVELPEGRATIYDRDDFYDAKSVLVGKQKLTFRHRSQAELAKFYCDLERRGFVELPTSAAGCNRVTEAWNSYLREMRQLLEPLASERTEEPERLEAILSELRRLLAAR